MLLLLLLSIVTGREDEAVVGRLVRGEVDGVVGKVEGVVDVDVDVEVNVVMEEVGKAVVLGCLSDSIDRRVWNEKQVP